jgi:hypothetical protein
MSARPNPDHAISQWLRDEADAGAPDRLIAAVRTQLESTDQRRAWWPARRFQSMNTTARFLGAAAAIAVVAAIAVLALPRVGGLGQQPSPSPVPTVPVSAIRLTLGAASGGDLPPGTYLIDDPFPVRATITVPAGWTPYTVDARTAGILVNHAKPVNGSGWGLFFLAGPHFYKDPCRPASGTVDASAVATAANVIATLSSMPSVDTSAPVAVTVGGRPATLLTLAAAADTATCGNPGATVWKTSDGTDYVVPPGEATLFRVVDVDGQPIVILATDFPQSSGWENQAPGATPNPTAHAADQVELRQILDSIQFYGRTPASPAPSASP